MDFEYSRHWTRKKEFRSEISDDMLEYAITNSLELKDKYWEDASNAICRIPPSGRILKVVYKRIGKNRYKITNLDNFFGPEVLNPKKGIEAIIVSGDTIAGARGINLIREDYGMKPLEIVQIGMVLASDRAPISSTRIRAKEIDTNGKILKRRK